MVAYNYGDDEVTVKDAGNSPVEGALVGFSNDATSDWDFDFTDDEGIAWSEYDIDTNDVIVVTNPNFLPSIRRMGHVTGNATWSGLVVVSGDLTVDQGASLTIKPGTKVLFEAYDSMSAGEATNKCEIKVLGHLIAKGTEDDSIFFGPKWSANSCSSWYSISVESNAKASIEYAEIKGAYIGLNLKPGSKDTILYCTFQDNFLTAIVDSSNDARIAHITIDRDSSMNLDAEYGIYLESINTDTAFSLLGNTIKNYKYGIRAVQCSTRFINNIITSAAPTVPAVYGIHVSTQSHVDIKECEVNGKFTHYVHCDTSRINL